MFSALHRPFWMPSIHQIAHHYHHVSRRCFNLRSRRNLMQNHYPRQWMNDYDGWESWTEDLGKYERGIYFAVHLGDELGSGRYRVLHKLGNGSFSQVWLARDQMSGGFGYVALKIVQAGTTEAQVLKHLAESPPDHPGHRHVMRLLDHFVLESTNGSYDGLILELVGTNVFDALENSLNGKLSKSAGRRASKQVATGLAYMHELSIGHGDLHVGNICFAALNVNHLSEKQIMSHLGAPYLRNVTRRDGKTNLPWVPTYTVKPSPFTEVGDTIKIVDLGQAFFFDRKPDSITTPGNVKAPELLFSRSSLGWDYRIDLWALGCAIYEVFVGKPVFNSRVSMPLAWEMSRVIGELPERWKSQLDTKDFLNSDGTPKELYEDLRSLEETLMADYEFLGGDMTRMELDLLAAFLRELLALEPKRRKSANEIANHHWLRES